MKQFKVVVFSTADSPDKVFSIDRVPFDSIWAMTAKCLSDYPLVPYDRAYEIVVRPVKVKR